MEIHERERGTRKFVVWCVISLAGLIGPFFLCDGEGHSVNVNGDSHLRVLQEFCVPELLAVANIYQVSFQQDGARAHCSREVRAFLDEQCPNGWIGCWGPVKWAPRLPDLTLWDSFLWGYINSKVYGTKPRDLPTLEERLRNACASVTSKCGPMLVRHL